MPYNELLSIRITTILLKNNCSFKEKKMFGGITVMINDKNVFRGDAGRDHASSITRIL